MKRIDNVTDLKQAWNIIVVKLRRDLDAARRLAMDPVSTLEELGYEVGPRARSALITAVAA